MKSFLKDKKVSYFLILIHFIQFKHVDFNCKKMKNHNHKYKKQISRKKKFKIQKTHKKIKENKTPTKINFQQKISKKKIYLQMYKNP